VLQQLLGHRDVASTRCYAKLGDDALIYALRSREASPNGDVLSPACPPGVIPKINLNNIKELMVEAAGIEPDHPQSTNRLMAHDFLRMTTIPSRFSPSIESPGVPSSPLESTPVVEISWRRRWRTKAFRLGTGVKWIDANDIFSNANTDGNRTPASRSDQNRPARS
jgi:hypothetical protein